VTRVPVAVDVNAPRLLEQPLHLVESGVEPDEVAGHAAFPDVGEGAQLVLITEDDVVLLAGEERRVDVDEVYALARKLAHHVQVVTPEQAVGFKLGVPELHPLHHLEGEVDCGEELPESLASVPSQRFLLYGYAAEARWRTPELFLCRKRILPLVGLDDFRRCNEVALLNRSQFSMVSFAIP